MTAIGVIRVATFFAIALIASASTGCKKTITVELDTYEERLAIESLLLPGTVPKVFLNRTVPFFATDNTPSELFVRGARVTISSASGTDFLVADSVYNKFWCRYEPYYIGAQATEADTEYTLTVEVGGETYAASTVTNVRAVTIDSVSYTTNFTDLYGGHEGVILDFVDIAGQPNQYRVQMNRPLDNKHETVDDFEYSSTCLADGELVEVREISRFVYFDTSFDGAPVRLVVEPAYTNRKGDPATLYVQSLNLDAAEFYDTLDRQRESNINPFIEPVFIQSQIDGAIGVFGAINRSAAVPFEFPEDSG